ncbi:MAG TPA: alpha/beta hydrolase [Gammaproteobacteria bacterium]
MRRTEHFPAIALAAALLSSADVPALAQPPPAVSDLEYTRVDQEPLRLDLWLPTAQGAPLLVWVHGGAWEFGSKRDVPVLGLVERGYALASIDFRPASAARFPGQLHDIQAAIRFLRARASDYGYDAARIGVLGASSGGHLAALAGVAQGRPELEGEPGEHAAESSAVQAVVSFFGASNLTSILEQSTPFGVSVRVPALERLLGGLPDALPELARLASPVFHVTAAAPPLLLLHGDEDPQMPIAQSYELEAAYRAAGADARLVVLPGARHGGEVFFDAERLRLVAEFLDRHLRAPSDSEST